ncbi:MAG: hypothetical protein ACI857_000947 [Arenicella sp.]|jgi:hypothetical protein
MKYCLLILSTLSYIYCIGQFSSFEKESKTGLNYGEEIIVKAKYDSISTFDNEIATAYKKDSRYYFNQSGNKISKKKILYSNAFKNGFAILSNKKGKYGAINAKGKLVIPFDYSNQFEQFGVLMLAKNYSSYHVYGTSERILGYIDSAKVMDDWFITYDKTSIYTEYKKENVLGKVKTKSYYHHDYYFNIYDHLKGTLILDSIDRYYFENGISVHKRMDSSIYLLDSDRKVVASGDYSSVQINENTIFCLAESDSTSRMDLRSINGSLIKDDVAFVMNLDSGRFIFSSDSLQFIGDEYGKQLSPKLKGFGTEENGWRIVFDGLHYTYMNDSTYELLDFRLPVILRTVSTPDGGSGGWTLGRGFRNMKKRIGNFGRRFIGKKKKPLETGSYSHYYKENKVPAHQFPIINGFLKIESSTFDSINSTETYFEDDHNFRAKYNYINLKGKRVNDIHYRLVEPIINGRFLALDSDGWQVVSTASGENLNKEPFKDVGNDTCGYHIVRIGSYPSMYGLLDKNLNEVLPVKYDNLEYLDSAFYERNKYYKLVKRFEIPE